MAKITSLKFDIKGVNHTINVNCTTSGQFTANIPSDVSSALNIESKVTTTTLVELENKIKSAIERYKKSSTTQDLFILIKYQSRGKYSLKEDGFPLFGGYRNKYELDTGHGDSIDALGFEFKVCIKETIDGAINWFETRIGSDFFPSQNESNSPDTYFKNGKCYHDEHWKKIPFSEPCLQTLLTARSKIRSVSEMLFNFIEQDENQILLMLNNNKLLGEK